MIWSDCSTNWLVAGEANSTLWKHCDFGGNNQEERGREGRERKGREEERGEKREREKKLEKLLFQAGKDKQILSASSSSSNPLQNLNESLTGNNNNSGLL